MFLKFPICLSNFALLNKHWDGIQVDFVADASSIARKMVILKTVFPSLSIPQVVSKKPRLFLQPEDELRNIAEQARHPCHQPMLQGRIFCCPFFPGALTASVGPQVSRLLDDAEDPGSILSDTPDLFDPAMVVSVLVTFQRWFPKDDPVKASYNISSLSRPGTSNRLSGTG